MATSWAFDHYPCQAKAPVMPQQMEAQKLRTLNVVVPEKVYWHVRKCAIESRLSMKDFMALFCQEARPYPSAGERDTSPQTADLPIS